MHLTHVLVLQDNYHHFFYDRNVPASIFTNHSPQMRSPLIFIFRVAAFVGGSGKVPCRAAISSPEPVLLPSGMLSDTNGSAPVNGGPSTPKMKRQKSVQLSPTIEKTTFIQSEPPSPERAATATTTTAEEPLAIRDQEHI